MASATERMQPTEGKVSYLQSWLAEHDMDKDEAMYRSKIDEATFGLLYDGEITIPSIALALGKNLGMTPDEVKHLSHPLSTDRFYNSPMMEHRQENFDSEWYKLVKNYKASKVTSQLVRPRKPLKQKQLLKNVCLLCGETFNTKAKRNYCPSCTNVINTLARQKNAYSSVGEKTRGVFCRNCGKPLRTVAGPIPGVGSTYCSAKCADIYLHKKVQDVSARTCQYCRKLFVPETQWQQYCCSQHLAFGVGVVDGNECVCEFCGLMFKPLPQNVGRQHYCSIACQKTAHNARVREQLKRKRELDGQGQTVTIADVLTDSR